MVGDGVCVGLDKAEEVWNRLRSVHICWGLVVELVAALEGDLRVVGDDFNRIPARFLRLTPVCTAPADGKYNRPFRRDRALLLLNSNPVSRNDCSELRPFTPQLLGPTVNSPR